MPRKKSVEPKQGHFGERLAAYRKQAGLTQRELEHSSGVSHRMIAYYEGRGALPPGHVLDALAGALGLSVDDLLGKDGAPARPRLSRSLLERISLVDQLPLKDKRELFGVIDAYLAKNQLITRSRRSRETKAS